MLTLMRPAFQANQRSGGQGRLSVSALVQTRARRDEAKKKLSEGVNPSFARKDEKRVRDVHLQS